MFDLPLEVAVGQLICPTLFGAEREGVPYDAAAAAEAVKAYGWGGFIVFHAEAETLRERVEALQRESAIPLLIAADLERGAGQQAFGCSIFPPAMAFGAAGDPALAYRLGAWTAYEARTVGINWVLAPVADVTVNPANPIIHIRSFSGEPSAAAAMVAAFVKGCEDHGALACAKHFPGHGDTGRDSHSGLATVEADRARLEAVEWPPFRAAIDADVATIMSAHLALPALGLPETPATLSREVMTGLLRDQLGFAGLVVTDAMLMGGVENRWDAREAAVAAIAAGCDMLLMPRDPVAVRQALIEAVAAGQLPASRIHEAAGRVLAAKARLQPATRPEGAHPEALAREVARRALTGAPGARVAPGTLAVAIDDGVEPARLAAWEEAVRAHGFTPGPRLSGKSPQSAWEAITAPEVVVGVFSPIRPGKDRGLLAANLVAPLRALARRSRVHMVSFSSPFLVSQVPEAAARVLTFGAEPVQIEAVIAALRSGEFPGTLPVSLPAHIQPAVGGDEGLDPNRPSFA